MPKISKSVILKMWELLINYTDDAIVEKIKQEACVWK